MIFPLQGVNRHSDMLKRLLGIKGPQPVTFMDGTAQPNAPLFDASQPELRLLRKERLFTCSRRSTFAALDTYILCTVTNPANSGQLTVVTEIEASLVRATITSLALWTTPGISYNAPAGGGMQLSDSRAAPTGSSSLAISNYASGSTSGVIPVAGGAARALWVAPNGNGYTVKDSTPWVLQPGAVVTWYFGLVSGTFAVNDLWSSHVRGYELTVDAAELLGTGTGSS